MITVPAAKKSKKKNPTTPLLEIAKHGDHRHERLNPFMAEPWRQRANDFGDQLIIRPAPPPAQSREESAKDKKKRLKEEHLHEAQTLAKEKRTVVVYTDGSMIKKKGFHRTGAAAVGFREGKEVFQKQLGLGGGAEVFDAEMAGLMIGVIKATRLAKRSNGEVSKIVIFADNTSAIQVVFEPTNSSGQYYARKFNRAVTAFLEENTDNQVIVAWCPSHCGIEGNDLVDKLAKNATERGRETPIGASRAFMLRRARQAVQEKWRRDWSREKKEGRFAISDMFPPSCKPTRHFRDLDGKRELFGRLVQARTGHGYTGEYYKQFVPDEKTDCPCGEPLQTREHLLRDCPRYEDQRYILREASDDIALADILGTKAGIEALTLFLDLSGAFTKSGKQRAPYTAPTLTLEEQDGNWDNG